MVRMIPNGGNNAGFGRAFFAHRAPISWTGVAGLLMCDAQMAF